MEYENNENTTRTCLLFSLIYQSHLFSNYNKDKILLYVLLRARPILVSSFQHFPMNFNFYLNNYFLLIEFSTFCCWNITLWRLSNHSWTSLLVLINFIAFIFVLNYLHLILASQKALRTRNIVYAFICTC